MIIFYLPIFLLLFLYRLLILHIFILLIPSNPEKNLFNDVLMTYPSLKKAPENNLQIDWATRQLEN